jgi:hypothetical protein
MGRPPHERASGAAIWPWPSSRRSRTPPATRRSRRPFLPGRAGRRRHRRPAGGRLVFHILGAIDEFQRELIVEGTREGLDAARARGRSGGRRSKLSDAEAATARRMY